METATANNSAWKILNQVQDDEFYERRCVEDPRLYPAYQPCGAGTSGMTAFITLNNGNNRMPQRGIVRICLTYNGKVIGARIKYGMKALKTPRVNAGWFEIKQRFICLRLF